MCGLVGVASTVAMGDQGWIEAGCLAIQHRGPDDGGTWTSDDRRVAFGFRRLAIVDLSPAGHQPMQYADGRLAMVFNGEIYNYRELRAELQGLGHDFRSSSDSEVLLAAYAQWGEACLARLDGMFALAIADQHRGTLLLARDRAGEKPMFYHLSQNTLHFGSELKAMLANPGLPRRVNRQALDCTLGLGHIPGDACILEGFNKLPPAHALSFDLASGKSTIWPYWHLPEVDAASEIADATTLTDELEALLEQSVARQLVADVPVGVLLSGGLDSSLVVAMAARQASHVRTFTVGFPGHEQFDERGHARLVARHFGTEHIELEATPVTADLLPVLARQFDEPIFDSSMIPTLLVSQLVRQHCTVALGGDGGDELFGGYPQYSHLQERRRERDLLPLPVRRALAYGAERIMPIGVHGRNFIRSLAYDPGTELPARGHYFDATTRRRLMSGTGDWPITAEAVHRSRTPYDVDIVQRATRMDFHNYLAEDILVKVDRASMLSSIELRAPMLDRAVIEFAFREVPSRLKATTGERKILLRQLAARALPPGFDSARKQGFSVPMAAWFKEAGFRQIFHDVLLDPGSMFDRDVVRGLLAGQKRGRSNGERLFGLLLVEMWRRTYGVTL
jgi:asparagine synthase (glutamine-hydrolysing)